VVGCTPRIAVTPSPENQDLKRWQTHQAEVASIENWELKGRIGVKTGNKGESATLKWVYRQNNQKVELYGPFGGGRVIIHTGENDALLRDTKGSELRGETAQDVLYQRLGWKVPFGELVMWSRGLPNPGAKNLEFDQNGFLTSLDEGTWHVSYQEYQIIDNFTLPRKLTITARPGTMEFYDDDGKYLGDDLNVKVVLKRWWDINAHSNE